MRIAARGLPAAERGAGQRLRRVHRRRRTPRALTWPQDRAQPRASPRMALARLAQARSRTRPKRSCRSTPTRSASTKRDRGRVLYQVALWTVASYLPDSARRLNAVPASAYDERLHEWRVREAMARSRRCAPRWRRSARWATSSAAIRAGSTSRRACASASARRGRRRPLYREAAREPEFHGFLAADRLGAALRAVPAGADDRRRRCDGASRAIRRSCARWTCSRIDRAGWAAREWDDARSSRFDDDERRIAVRGRAAPTAGSTARCSRWATMPGPDDLRLLLAALPAAPRRRHPPRSRAVNALDPAWVAGRDPRREHASCRARARGANAMGLMQVLPGTGAAVARRIGLPWRGAREPVRPRHQHRAWAPPTCARCSTDYGGQPYLAIAAYNAGPAPVERWQSQRAGHGSGLLDRDASATRKRASTSRACSPSAWSTTGASTATPRR